MPRSPLSTVVVIADKVRAFHIGAADSLVKPVSPAMFSGQMLLLRRAGHIARNLSVR